MKKLKRVVIKEELVELTGNYKLALVLNQFLYWTERVGIKRYNKFEKEETQRAAGEVDGLEGGWIYKTSKDLSEELMIDVSDTTVRRYINELEDQGYLIERRNPKIKFDQTKQYRILLLEVKNDLEELGYQLQGYKYSDKAYGCTNPHNEDWNSNNVDCNSINEDSNSNNVDAIPESTSDSTSENTSDIINGEKNNKEELISELKEPYKDMLSVNMINIGHIDEIIKFINKGLSVDLVKKMMKETKLAKKPSMFYLRARLEDCLDKGITDVSEMDMKSKRSKEGQKINPSGNASDEDILKKHGVL